MKLPNTIKSIDTNKAIKLSIIASMLLVSFSIFYYYVIFLPKKEKTRIDQQKQEQLTKGLKEQEVKTEIEKQRNLNAMLLQICLNEADLSLRTNFTVLCGSDERISGGDKSSCSTDDTETVIGYMTVSEFYTTHFKRILDKREKDRGECFKKYPQR